MRTRLRGRRAKNPTPEEPGEERAEQAFPPGEQALHTLQVLRMDKRTKNLTKRLRPGDIALIDHQDIDRVAGEALVAARPSAVLNAAASISGAYPNLGPEIIVAAGIPLIDEVGAELFEIAKEGELSRTSSRTRSSSCARSASCCSTASAFPRSKPIWPRSTC